MKNLLLLFVALSLFSCKKDGKEPDVENRIFRVKITGPAFAYSIGTKSTATGNVTVLSSSTSRTSDLVYEFTPEVGKTVNIKLTTTGTVPATLTVDYKTSNLEFRSCTGCAFEKDYPITN